MPLCASTAAGSCICRPSGCSGSNISSGSSRRHGADRLRSGQPAARTQCTFCTVTGRRPPLDLDTRRYFAIADREDLSYAEKLAAYRALADEYFETDRYHDFCDSRLGHVDEVVLDWVSSTDFDRLLVDTVRSTYPPDEYERFVGHLRGLVGQWLREQSGHPVWTA